MFCPAVLGLNTEAECVDVGEKHSILQAFFTDSIVFVLDRL